MNNSSSSVTKVPLRIMTKYGEMIETQMDACGTIKEGFEQAVSKLPQDVQDRIKNMSNHQFFKPTETKEYEIIMKNIVDPMREKNKMEMTFLVVDANTYHPTEEVTITRKIIEK